MSCELNETIIAGNLTRDPVIRYLPNENCVANFTLANTRRRTVNGESREATTFLDCEVWGKTAEVIAKHFIKGKPIIAIGLLKQESWEDKDTGKKRSKIVLVLRSFQFLPDGKPRDGAATGAPPAEAPAAPATPPAVAADEEPPF